MAVFAHSSHVESPDPGTKSQGPMRAKILLCYESERKQLNTEYSTEKCPCRRGFWLQSFPIREVLRRPRREVRREGWRTLIVYLLRFGVHDVQVNVRRVMAPAFGKTRSRAVVGDKICS